MTDNLYQEFVNAAFDAQRLGNMYPIELTEKIWLELGYARKDHAVRRIESDLILDEDYVLNLLRSGENRPENVYKLSTDGYDHLCMLANTPEGREIRKMFIMYKKEYFARLESLITSSNTTNDEYLAKISQLEKKVEELSKFKADWEVNTDLGDDPIAHIKWLKNENQELRQSEVVLNLVNEYLPLLNDSQAKRVIQGILKGEDVKDEKIFEKLLKPPVKQLKSEGFHFDSSELKEN